MRVRLKARLLQRDVQRYIQRMRPRVRRAWLIVGGGAIVAGVAAATFATISPPLFDSGDREPSEDRELDRPRPDGAPRQLGDLTEQEWALIYQLESATADCLRGEGIVVPPIPEQQDFIARYQSSDPWLSYQFVGEVGEARWEELNSNCQQPEI